MLGVEWSTEVGEDFTESLHPDSKKEPPNDSRMFHGTIDLIGSSDDEYESDLIKPEEEVAAQNDATIENNATAENVNAAENCVATDNEVSTTECDDAILQENVANVVSDIVDFVERMTMLPGFGFDPDAMNRQNDEVILKEGSCMKPHCQLGCLCSSLRGAFQHVPTHCSKERCMFECHCQERGLSAIDDESHYADKSKRKKKIPNRFRDAVLGRAYKKLHAQSIHDAVNQDSDSDPDFESHLIPPCKKTSPVSSPPKASSPEPKKDGNGLVQSKADNSWIHSDKIANIKKTIQERRVGFVAKTMTEEQTLADVNIWCSQHNKYSCLCINYVYFSKTNYLLWKPSNKSRYLANKVMFEIMLKEPSHNEVPYEVFAYNRNNHCARTYGQLLDYKVRNKDEFFVAKRKLELEHNVLSYSNSYVKFKNFLLVKASESGPSAEPYNKSGKKKTMGKLVNIINTMEKMKVDVGEDNLDGKANYQLDNGFSEEEEEQKMKVSGRKRKLTQKMKELEEERRKEKEAELEDMKRIQEEIRLRKAMEEVPAKVPRKRGRPPKQKPEMPAEKPLELIRCPSNTERSTIREPTPEVEICCKKNGLKFGVDVKKEEVTVKQEPASPDYFSAESRMDTEVEPSEEDDAPGVPAEFPNLNTDKPRTIVGVSTVIPKTNSKVSSKALKDCLGKEFREDNPKPFLGFSDCDDNSELEDCDSDLIDSIHSKKVLVLSPRTDGYPHLGLMCLTPGVGYLNVTESLRERIVINDPINPAQRQTFTNLQHANDWLNRFFRSSVAFSTPDLVLQWILVTPGILKLKQSKLLNPEIFRDPNMVITRNGPVRFAPSHRKNLNVANNCTLLRKQLSQHSVFRPLIKKQLAMRETAKFNVFRHPKFSVNERRWVPNPKFGKKPTKKLQPIEERFQSINSLVSLQRVQNLSFDTSVGCVTVQRVPFQPSPDIKRISPATRPPQLTPIDVAKRTLQFTRIDQRVHPQVTGINQCIHPRVTSVDQCISPQCHPQVTLRPLPSLTKILSNKPGTKFHPEKKE